MATIIIEGGEIEILPPEKWALDVHDEDQCAGRTCIIHAPTLHHMRQWPLNWRSDRQIFERICDHRVGHPDPDQRDFWRELAEKQRDSEIADGFVSGNYVLDPERFVGRMLNHTCDGCCAEHPAPPPNQRGATAP